MSNPVINWKVFEYKFADNPNDAFESLAYYLFCYEFKQNSGIFRFFNQAGIETEPIEYAGEILGFQAKYYDASTKISEKKKDFINSIDIVKRKYPQVSKIIFYTNKEFSQSSKKDTNEPQYLKDIKSHAQKSNINIEWRVKSHFEKMLLDRELENIYNIFFNPRFEKDVNILITQKQDINFLGTQIANNIFWDKSLNSEILDRSIKQVLRKAKKDIDIGNYDEVNGILKDYMITQGFDELKSEIKIDIIYYRSICLLNLGNYNEAKVIAEQILRNDKNSLRYYEIYVSMSILMCNRDEFNKNIKILRELNEEENKILKYELKMLYIEKNYKEIINRYTVDNVIDCRISQDDECVGIIIASLLNKNYADIAVNILEEIEIKSPYLKFLKAVANLSNVLNDRENLLELKNNVSKVLDENIKLLETVKEDFNKDVLYKKSYYYYLLQALLFQNPKKCIIEYEYLEESLKQNNELKIIYIDALCISSNIDLAEKNIYEIPNYNNDIDLLGRLVDILYEKKEYKKIVDLLKDKELEKIKDCGLLAKRYIKALLNIQDFETVEKIVNNKYKDIALVNISMAEYLFLNSDDIKKVEEYCHNSVNTINKENELLRNFIASICEKINFPNKSIEILEKKEFKLRKTKELYIRNVIKYKKSSENSKRKALRIVNELLKEEEKSVLWIYKGEILKKINRYLEAFECFEKSFILDSNPVTAYYCLGAKIELEDYTDVDKYILVLDTSEEIEHMLMVAFIHSKLNEFDLCNKIIYKISFKIEKNMDMDVLAKIVFGIYFVNYREYEWEEIERVQDNVIVELEDNEKNIRKICIDTDVYVDEDIKRIFDIELFSFRSLMRNRVMLKKINDSITIDNKSYKIKRLINKYEYIFNILRDSFFKSLPEKSKYGTIIKTDINNPIEGIMPYLKERRDYTNNIIDTYRMKENEIGLTINLLAKQMGCTEINIIHSLLYDSNEVYYAGEVSEISNEEYVVSLTSLIIFKIFGMDKKLIEIKDRIHVAESTAIKLNKYFFSKANDDSSASIGVQNDDKPYVIEKNEFSKEKELEFIRELIELIYNFKIEKNNYPNDYLEIYSMLSEDEQDSLCIAQNNNYTLIADDLCLRKIYRVLAPTNSHSNSIEFMKFFPIIEKINILEKISKTQYLYCIDASIIMELILFHNKDNFDKVKNIIKNLLETRLKYDYHRKIIGQALYALYKEELSENQKKKFIEIVKLVFQIDAEYKENKKIK